MFATAGLTWVALTPSTPAITSEVRPMPAQASTRTPRSGGGQARGDTLDRAGVDGEQRPAGGGDEIPRHRGRISDVVLQHDDVLAGHGLDSRRTVARVRRLLRRVRQGLATRECGQECE